MYLKAATYSGAHHGAADTNFIANGYRMAFIVMMNLTMLAIAVSYWRDTRKESI